MNILRRLQVYKKLRKEYLCPSDNTSNGLCKCLYMVGCNEDLDTLIELYEELPRVFKQGWLLYAFPRGEVHERLECIENALVKCRTEVFALVVLWSWVLSCLVSLGLSL